LYTAAMVWAAFFSCGARVKKCKFPVTHLISNINIWQSWTHSSFYQIALLSEPGFPAKERFNQMSEEQRDN